MANVYVIGGSGYTGGDLLRILLNHPKIEKITVSSRQHQGKRLSEQHPALETDITFEDYNEKKANDADFVFTCTPHTKAMEYASKLDTKIIDLSADFRLKSAMVYEKTYQVKHTAPELIPQAVYGLPEIRRKEIKKTRILANPGCMATSAILALWPLARNFKVERVVVDTKTGISGAGREPTETNIFGWVDENMIPYKVMGHRHVAEMEQETGLKVYFTPHIAPMSRGILTSVHAFAQGDMERVRDIYKKAYKDEPFTKVVDKIPTPLAVRGSNYCHIGGFTQDGDRLVLFSALDNLVKGASGQAVQNMNIMAGWDEKAGIGNLGLCP